MSKHPFKDITDEEISKTPRESPPSSVLRRPYWLLRVLRRIIVQGGYLTSKVYVPELVWRQYGVKFSGLNAKTAAFEQIMFAVTSRVYPVDLPTDKASSLLALNTLRLLVQDLNTLQNNLAKPFPFIREIPVRGVDQSAPPSSSNVSPPFTCCEFICDVVI